MSTHPRHSAPKGGAKGVSQAIAQLKRQVKNLQSGPGVIESIDGSAITPGSITTTEIATDTITAGNISAGAITSSELDTDSVIAGKIAANAITAANLQADSVTAAAIQAGTITGNLIQTGTLTANLIQSHAITAAQIAAGTITATEIAANTITAGNIAASTITGGNIAAGTIDAGNIIAHSLTANEIAAGTITATEIRANTITAAQIAVDTITANEIATNAITTNEIAANTIQAGDIAAGTITATQIAAGTITTSLMTAGTINADRLSSGTITSGLLATDSVTSAAIVSGAVTSTKISVSQLSAIASDMGTLTSGLITGATVQTATSGKRVVMNSGGITAYGGTGSTVVLNFDTTTGNLVLLGTVTASSSSIIPATTINASGGGIVSGQIQDATIQGTDIAARTIAAGNIIADSITAAEIATDAITTNEILARTIQAGDIATGTLTANEIQSGSITADRLNVTDLTAITSNFTTLTSGTITGALIRTAASPAARIEIQGSSNAIKTYDSSNVQIQQIDAVEGVAFLAPSGGVANKQSVRWTTSIGGTEAASLKAFSSGGAAYLMGEVKTTVVSAQSDVYLQATNFAGHGNFIQISALSNNTGGKITASVRNTADTAPLNTTIIDDKGDMTVNGNVILPNTTAIKWAASGHTQLLEESGFTERLTIKGGSGGSAYLRFKDSANASLGYVGGEAGGAAVAYDGTGAKKTTLADASGNMTVSGNIMDYPKVAGGAGAARTMAYGRLTCSASPSITLGVGITGIARNAQGVYTITHAAMSPYATGVATTQGNGATSYAEFAPVTSTTSQIVIRNDAGGVVDGELVTVILMG